MMTKDDERKIIDSLANDTTVEMKYDDLEQILNNELSKNENEIDAQLVFEVLNVLEPSKPDPAQIQARWPYIKENLPKCQVRKRKSPALLRFAAAAAVISIILVSTIEDAGAFRWTLLQKFLKPVAETFGIVIDDQEDDDTDDTESSVYSVSDAPSDFVTYATLDEVPEMCKGYMISPRWLPEGFVFSAGSRFTSIDSEVFTLDFSRNEKTFSLHIHISTIEPVVYSRDFERNLDRPIEVQIGQHNVTFYNNATDKKQSAFWIHENAHYMLVGEITVEEITCFVESMI